MTFTIAGIGSRETPKDILKEMKTIGEWCRINGVTIRSGHADGADWAFESGAQDLCVAYIPWNGFNAHLVSDAEVVLPEFTKELMELAEQFHPAWDKLTHGVKKLIARDGVQVLGSDLRTPSNMIVCWTKGGKAVGGTGQALRIAEANHIHVVNMSFQIFNTADKVIREIKTFKDSVIVME
jgi:hypothetical protein